MGANSANLTNKRGDLEFVDQLQQHFDSSSKHLFIDLPSIYFDFSILDLFCELAILPVSLDSLPLFSKSTCLLSKHYSLQKMSGLLKS